MQALQNQIEITEDTGSLRVRKNSRKDINECRASGGFK